MNPEKSISRMEFLKRCARLAAFAGLGWLTVRVSTRRSRSGETCINDWICRNCGILSGCGLPQALSFRRATRDEKS